MTVQRRYMTAQRKLIGSGGSQLCDVGLVDERGAFLYLTDTGETKHFNFTSEHELIESQRDEIAEISDELERLQKRFEALDHIAEAMYWELDGKTRKGYAQRLKKIGIKYGNKK